MFFLGIPVAYWAMGALGTAVTAQVVWMSPAGEPARKATERALTNAFTRSDTTCRDCEPCPVCGQRPNPTPGQTPGYVRDNRKMVDHESPILSSLSRANVPQVQGANVYNYNGGFAHRDNFHVGKAAELETYDRRGRHTGTICPHCGAPRGGPVPGRTLP